MDKRSLMKLELVRKYREEYIVNLASIGEPMDPELLNPARKRKDVKEESEEEKTDHVLLLKEWTRYISKKYNTDAVFLRNIIQSRNKALKELKKVSVPLYERSLEIVTDLLPFERKGPTYTPPNPTYEPPEEEEKDK